LLARKYGENFREELKNRYLKVSFFDMFHLLSNQLGLTRQEDIEELVKVLYAFRPEIRNYTLEELVKKYQINIK